MMKESRFTRHDNASPEDRFWAKVDKSPGQGPDGDCWGWLACMVSAGYGGIVVDGRLVYAHRLSYELHHGPIPEGKKVRHTCDNPPCCNPDHLLLGTQQDNADDMVRRGRSARGERSTSAKLTTSDVIAIRMDQRPCPQIATEYGVSGTTIRRAKGGSSWKHVV